MYIRPRYLSKQHEMLLDLERIGNEVFYSAPAFHEPYQLNSAYLTNNVRNRSIWVRSSLIGDIVDDEHHYVAFQHPGSRYFRSKHEKHIDSDVSFKGVAARLTNILKNAHPFVTFMETASTLADHLEEITRKTVDISPSDIEITIGRIKERPPLYKIAYYAHVFFGAQFFIIQKR